jgi:hypothetical protein
MRLRTAAGAAAIVALAGCGGGAPAASPATSTPRTTPAASPTPSPPPGPEAFLADVRKAGLGDKDVQSASDRQLLHFAKIVCDGFDNGLGYQDLIQIMQSAGHHITTRQGAVWVDSAVRNLCPTHLSEIPSGAP